MFAPLDALVGGAVVAMLAAPPALLLFWRIARPCGAAPRWTRPLLACCAAYGGVAAAGGLHAIKLAHPSVADEAIAGALITGGLLLLVAFPILFLITPRKA